MNTAPYFYLHLRFGQREFVATVPPRWWFSRSCRRGVCAYGNYWCPNGCDEHVDVDEVRA